MKYIAYLIVVFLGMPSCQPDEYHPPFKSGDIVRVKLTGERLSVIGQTNRFGVYDGRFDVRNYEGYIREMMPGELELEK